MKNIHISLRYITRFLKGHQKALWKRNKNKKAWLKILHRRMNEKEQEKDVCLNLDKKCTN